MKNSVIVSLILVVVVFFVPWLWSEPTAVDFAETQPPPDETAVHESERIESPPPAAAPLGEHDSSVMLRVLVDGTVQEMDLGTYLVGVVRAEMPAVFHEEALKAQAVAARTYTLYKMENGGSSNHPQADACDDINCCKAYLDAAAAADGWKATASLYEEKMRAAILETDGECVLYEGSPILALFHSSSAGETLDAADVWSGSLPYLKSVATPESSETVPNYRCDSSFTLSSLKTILGNALPDAELAASPSNWFTNIQQRENGTVTRLDVGGVTVSGNEFRRILGLRSACFTFSFEGDHAVFSVTGYGHGVGMSQYGANLLAESGMTYREILTWYYTDTTVDIYHCPPLAE